MKTGEALRRCIDDGCLIRKKTWSSHYYIKYDDLRSKLVDFVGVEIEINKYSNLDKKDEWEIFVPKRVLTLWIVGIVEGVKDKEMFIVTGTYGSREDAVRYIHSDEHGPFSVDVEV